MVLVVMGAAGAGKTTIGRHLASELGWTFHDADDFHSPENVAKMSRGLPLDEADRRPWLERLAALIRGCLERGENAVLACSALREDYRSLLAGGSPGVTFVYLRASPDLLAHRLAQREGHYAGPALLDSQLATLEEPRDALAIDAGLPPEEIVRIIRREHGARAPGQ
jgi:gluconokinase